MRNYKKGSLMDVAVQSYRQILELAKSKDQKDKLLAQNVLLAVAYFTLLIASYLTNSSADGFVALVILALSAIFGVILIAPYLKFVQAVLHAFTSGTNRLIWANSLLYVALGIQLAGYLIRTKIFISTAMGLFVIQFLANVLPIPDSQEPPRLSFGNYRPYIHDLSAVLGILSFVLAYIWPSITKAIGIS